MEGTWVQSLVQEDPTCRRATKPMCLNYWACVLEPVSHNYWACASQLQKPACPRAHTPQLLSPCTTNTEVCAPRALCSTTREAIAMRNSHTTMKSSPCSPQLEKAHVQQWRPKAAKKKKERKQTYGHQGISGVKDKLGDWDWHIDTTIYKIDN